MFLSAGGALSTGYEHASGRIEAGGEGIGILVMADTGHAAAGAGPYVRLRPVPGNFGSRFFLHAAGYGGAITNGKRGVIPWAFLAYEWTPKINREDYALDEDLTHFFGLGSEGFIFGVRF